MNNSEKSQPELTVALGAGGEYGIAVNLAILEAVKEHSPNIDLKTIRYLGTSAGAWAAAMASFGMDFNEIKDLPLIDPANPETEQPGFLQNYAKHCFGEDAELDNVRAAAVPIQRVGPVKLHHPAKALDSREYDLNDIVAASSAVPGVFAPVDIEGQLYIDGVMNGSTVHPLMNTDKQSYNLLATAPMAFHQASAPTPKPLIRAGVGLFLKQQTALEMSISKRKLFNKAQQYPLITPDNETSKLIRSIDSLFDRNVSIEAYKRTYDHIGEMLNDSDSQLARTLGNLALYETDYLQPHTPKLHLPKRRLKAA